MAVTRKPKREVSKPTRSVRKRITKGSSKRTKKGKPKQKLVPQKREQKPRKQKGDQKSKPNTKSKPSTQQGQKPQSKSPPQKKGNKLYSLNGELTIDHIVINIIAGKPFVTPEVVLDAHGNAFAKSVLDVDQGGVRSIVKMDAEQVELILKTLGVVDV